MENYIGLLISIEEYHNSDKLSKVLYAHNDSETLLDTLLNLGIPSENLELLQDNYATKAAIETKISKIAEAANDRNVIILYFAGHGLLENGTNYLTSVETDMSAISPTSVSIDHILSILDKSRANKIVVFLDCCHSGISFSKSERSPQSNFSAEDLKYHYKDSEHLITFASCKDSEKSQTDTANKHGVWSYFLLRALTGNAPEIYESGILFSDKLQDYLHDNTFRRVKEITKEKKNQNPVKFGKESASRFIVADVSSFLEAKAKPIEPEKVKFEKATIISYDDFSVKKLPGFKAGHKIPKEKDSYHEEWIKKISYDLIKEKVDEMTTECRQKLKLKRKDLLNSIIDNGYGELSTIYFDYTVTIEQSNGDPSKCILIQRIENFKNSEILYSDEFNTVFDSIFNIIEFHTSDKIEVEKIIDKIEELGSDVIRVEYSMDNISECKIDIEGFYGQIDITENSISFYSYGMRQPKELMNLCGDIYNQLEQGVNQKLIE